MYQIVLCASKHFYKMWYIMCIHYIYEVNFIACQISYPSIVDELSEYNPNINVSNWISLYKRYTCDKHIIIYYY